MEIDNLKALLKVGDNQIKQIKEEQLLLIANFIKDNYGYEKGTIILVNNIKGVIVGFVYNSLDKSIDVKYKQLKYNNTLASIIYNVKLRKFEIDGKYTGK